jgi:methylglutaconyl-CoA hydratase
MGLTDRLVEVSEEEAQTPGVARSKVLSQAIALANDICEGGPVAIRAALQAVNGWHSGEEGENKAYEIVLPTADRTEALTAFGEKRKPMFKGK